CARLTIAAAGTIEYFDLW
nr:immunoglobulin heavy chain junction region [Macaca mulatta]MOW45773.1 immunoglobulin heavy chain junction region [Macaca mulatta]MOW46746.1 immunoglobulin heavy chain junction region [Macaca mulatta]